MKRMIFAVALLLGSPAFAVQQWVTDAQTSASVTAPIGTAADPSFGKDGLGRPRCNVHLPNGAIAPFRCKEIVTTSQPPATNSGPAVFFTDLLNGPPDAFLTLYGIGLGSSGTVTVGGMPATVVRWTDTRVTIHPGRSGAIAVNGKDTGLVYSAVPSKVTLISSDAGIQACIDAANPGDQCVIRGGTYSPVHPQYDSFFSVHHTSGTAAAAISIVGYPGELVQFTRTTQTRGFHFYASSGHVVIANLHIDAKQAGVGIGNSGEDCPTDIRIVGNEVANFWAEGGGDAAISGSGTNYHWLGNYLHDNGGSKLYHAMYFDARCSAAGSSELAYNRIERQTGGRGIQIFGDTSRPLITNISIHHNAIQDVGLNCILFGDRTGAGMEAHHNVVARCANPAFRGKTTDEGTSGSCIRFNSTSVQVNAYNNTFTQCDIDGDAESAGITFQAAANVTLKDNVIVAKRYASGIPPAGNIITGNDWFSSGAPPAFDTAPLNIDPELDGAFRPQAPSLMGKGAL